MHSARMHSFAPYITKNRVANRYLLKTARRLSTAPPADVEHFRFLLFDEIDALSLDETYALHLRTAVSILIDLHAHGWAIRVDDQYIGVCPPDRDRLAQIEHKNDVRKSLLLERDAQLRQPSTRRFIAEMEKRRLHGRAFTSILSLLRDGPKLAQALDNARSVEGADRIALLREAIDPYVQVVEPGEKCAHTGLNLQDIWRYFRHTWATPYRSVPGRQLSFLIRDRAAPHHPIIGIGSLASSVVQQRRRDEWIRWDETAFLTRLKEDNYQGWAPWIDEQLIALLNDVYVTDFIRRGVIRRRDLRAPSREIITKLQQESAQARMLHRRFRQEDLHKAAGRAGANVDWRRQAGTHLFRSKRAGRLAELLQARLDLMELGFTKSSGRRLQTLLRTSRGRRAIRTILRLVKASHVGIDMMDISVCGAIAPYGPILGGKLVSLLLASPVVVEAYAKRYATATSVIASSMAGRRVRRSPRLVLLMTTSLYRVASSQYNRLSVPAERLGADAPLSYLNLEHTAGFGSYHFSRTTMEAIEVLLARSAAGREVNSIFGEGVNPKLRKIRSALNTLGLPANELLQHGAPRIVYAVPLAANFRDVLIGRSKRPRYLVPRGKTGTRKLIDYWFERWLAKRIEREDVINQVESHTTVFPLRHGGRVGSVNSTRDFGRAFEQAL